MSSDVCSGSHWNRLFVGEGNFSAVEAFLNKQIGKKGHDKNLGEAITATEIIEVRLEEDCSSCKMLDEIQNGPCTHCVYTTAVLERIDRLTARGVTVLFGVDARDIQGYFGHRRFERIHWNFPNLESGDNDYKKGFLPKVIKAFFESCSEVQDFGDKVYITLAEPLPKKKGHSVYWRNAYYYGLPKATSKKGSFTYVLLKKHKFEPGRYEGYEHKITGLIESAETSERGREYVFTKQEYKNEEIKSMHFKGYGTYAYYDMKSDSESLDLSDLDECSE